MCAFQGKLGEMLHLNKAGFWSQKFRLHLVLVDFMFSSVVFFKPTHTLPRDEEFIDTREYKRL